MATSNTVAGKPRQSALNKLSPAASKAKLGDVTADLIKQVNALTTAYNGLLAKLDADAGVTDTNYASLKSVPSAAIVDLESR